MKKEHPAYKVAVVQAAPCFLDLEATIEKCCKLIEEAADHGAKLIAFPESFVPSFPIWIYETGPFGLAGELFRRLHDNAVEVPSDALRRISEAARKAHIYVCLGVSEREGATLFLTQVWFDDMGNIIGKHRKLKPTGPERYIWGDGDGSTMPIFKTPLGNLGGLNCWEHMVPLYAAFMASQNEQVHVASWPIIGPFVRKGLSNDGESEGIGEQSPKSNPGEPRPYEVAIRHYAASTQSYVLAATIVLPQSHIDEFCGDDLEMRARFVAGKGHSRIIAPDGGTIGDILPPDEEGLLYADISLDRIVYAKYMLDTGGHYAAPQVLSINYNGAAAPICHVTAEPPRPHGFTYEEMQDLDA